MTRQKRRERIDVRQMKIGFQKSLNRVNMVISGQEGAQASDDSLQMVVQNRIPFLIPVSYEEIDSQIRLVYDISSKVSLTEYMKKRRLAKRELSCLIRDIGSCTEMLQEYLLDPKLLMLRPDCIFTDLQTEAAAEVTGNAKTGTGKQLFSFCYDPFYEGHQQMDLQKLFERLIACIDYEDQELVRMTYEMFAAVQREAVQWKDVEAVIREYPSAHDYAHVREQPDPELYIQTETQTDHETGEDLSWDIRHPDPEETLRDMPQDVPGKAPKEGFLSSLRCYLKKHSFREVLTDIDDGLILQKIHEESAGRKTDAGGAVQRHHTLEGVGGQTDEFIELVKFPFYIGKLKGKCDYILDRDTVSRNHLCICKDPREDGCLIIDQKSRNGTFLNGRRIRPMVRERVHAGDHIRLADAEFVFH